MPNLSASARARLPARAFAYIDSQSRRRLPIHDASHVRNALARFDQVAFESDDAREQARRRLLLAAKKYGIVPVGFFGGQLKKERTAGEIAARSADVASLPRGTLTFLLTDIEGSTRLVRALGEAYTALLRTLRSIIRANVRRAGGHEVDARADEFFGVFEDAAAALGAAVAIQRAMSERSWPAGQDVRIRIGMDRGRPTLTETGYVGIAVHTAARICWAGHGGQILLSSSARNAMDSPRAGGITFRSLGRYALPGIAEREPLFQAQAPDLRSDFPRLRRAPRTA